MIVVCSSSHADAISYRFSKSSDTKAATAAIKKAKSSINNFPSAYTFETSEEEEAKRRRAQRFEREREMEDSKNANQLKGFIPRQVAGHASSLDVTAGADGDGAVRVSQMGAGRSAGKWLGGRLGATDTAVDPVSLDGSTRSSTPLMIFPL
jgi:hypothetical protein